MGPGVFRLQEQLREQTSAAFRYVWLHEEADIMHVEPTFDPNQADDDFETAVLDPSAYFATPEAIVADTSMTSDQKQRFLSEWAQDLTARQTAAQEGMVPEAAAGADNDGALLKRVSIALEQLEDHASAPKATPRQRWQRRSPPIDR